MHRGGAPRGSLSFKPDVIIALGGGSPMDAAKVVWLMYENPSIKFEGLSLRFMDIRKRVYDIQENKTFKSQLVCIPTTSGTGSEVTPFSVVTDSEIHQKFPLADYVLTPSMAIIDPQLVMAMPKRLTAYGGIDALTHALESYVSILATDYTKGLSREATLMLFKHLPTAYKNPNDVVAREKVHNAATIAGMAFGNAFLGICHSMAHKLGAEYHIPHGLANGALISHVIRYNATDKPFKQSAFPQYESPHAKADYAALADALALGGSTEDEKVILLINAIEDLKKKLEIPSTIREIIQTERGVKKVTDEEYRVKLEVLGEDAFDDQCTGSNPRFPLIPDLRRIMLDAYSAPITPLKSLHF